MAKVLCESCGTCFLYKIVKDMKNCPVCGEALWDDTETVDNADALIDEDEAEDGLMYFDEIDTSYKEHPEYNGVLIYCSACEQLDSLDFELFDKIVDKAYVILKKDVTVKCRGCGKEHKPRKILYKRKDNYAPPLPRCPVCNSTMLKKIKNSSKFWAAATLGSFALPYNSKTYECQNCNYRF